MNKATSLDEIKDQEKFIASDGHIYQKIIMVNIINGTEHTIYIDYGSVEGEE